MNSFGRLLYSLRKEKGSTLQTVADAIDSHKGYVSSMERSAVNPPSPKMVKKLAAFFRVPYLDLLELAEVSKSPKEIRSRLMGYLTGNKLATAEISSVGASTVVGL